MYLVRRTHSVKRGETILIRAARPTLVSYTAAREDLLTASRELFEVVQSGAVKIAVNQTYPLREAARAHRDLEGRKTTGQTVLTV